jgi:hypothetical protein
MSATTRRRAHNRREQLEGLQRRVAIITRFHELVRDGHPVTGIQAAIARGMGLNRSTVCRQHDRQQAPARRRCSPDGRGVGHRTLDAAAAESRRVFGPFAGRARAHGCRCTPTELAPAS